MLIVLLSNHCMQMFRTLEQPFLYRGIYSSRKPTGGGGIKIVPFKEFGEINLYLHVRKILTQKLC